MFDLPEPFGPTIDVMGEANSSELFLPKDLKPRSSRLFKYILGFYHEMYPFMKHSFGIFTIIDFTIYMMYYIFRRTFDSSFFGQYEEA